MPGRSNRRVSNLHQIAVLWRDPIPTSGGGRDFDPPIEVRCRWEYKSEIYMDRFTNEEVRSTAVVYVDRDIQEGELLYLGRLNSLTSAQMAEPMLLLSKTAHEIRGVAKIPSLKLDVYHRKAFL